MSKKWHSGPPPSVGWWPASLHKSEGVFRWWNGKVWSVMTQQKDSAKAAGYCASIPSGASEAVEWQHRPASWPERSRT